MRAMTAPQWRSSIRCAAYAYSCDLGWPRDYQHAVDYYVLGMLSAIQLIKFCLDHVTKGILAGGCDAARRVASKDFLQCINIIHRENSVNLVTGCIC